MDFCQVPSNLSDPRVNSGGKHEASSYGGFHKSIVSGEKGTCHFIARREVDAG
jgi:hypothetical protein